MWGSVCWLSAICEHCCSQSPMPCLWHCFLSGRLCADSAAWWGRREGSRLLPDFLWVYTKAREQHTASESCHTAGHVSRYNTHTHTHVHMHAHAHTHTRAAGWVDFWNTRTESAEVLQVDESMCVHMSGAATEPSCFHRPLKQFCVGSTNPDLSSVRLGSGAWDHLYRLTVQTPVLSSSYFML